MNLSYIYIYYKTLFLYPKLKLCLILGFTAGVSGILGKLVSFYDKEHLEVAVNTLIVLLVVNAILMFVDLLIGVLGNKISNNETVESHKWGYSVGKYFGLILYFLISFTLLMIIPNRSVLYFLLYMPLILSMLREYISIGENIKKTTGKTPYLFTLIDELFILIQKKFFTKFDNITNQI